jgi:hypothetical protein
MLGLAYPGTLERAAALEGTHALAAEPLGLWRQEFGGLKTDQVRRLKQLETENARLRRAVAELTLDKQILKEAASGNY